MKYILDAIVIGAVIMCVFSGRQRGAVRTLILIAGYAAAFAAAVFVSRTASDYVYEKAVRPAVISAVETKSEELAEEYLSPEKLGGILKQQGISLTDEQLAEAGIPAGLVRMSCGLESKEDLIDDIAQALAQVN